MFSKSFQDKQIERNHESTKPSRTKWHEAPPKNCHFFRPSVHYLHVEFLAPPSELQRTRMGRPKTRRLSPSSPSLDATDRSPKLDEMTPSRERAIPYKI